MEIVRPAGEPSQLSWLTSSLFCTRAAILLTGRFCIPPWLCPECSWVTAFGQCWICLLAVPFSCGVAVTLMPISRQSAECCSHRWASPLAAHTCLAADQLRALVLAQEKKEAIHFIFASTSNLLSLPPKNKLGFFTLQVLWCVWELGAGFAFSLPHWYLRSSPKGTSPVMFISINVKY